jgi:hypothetical protein
MVTNTRRRFRFTLAQTVQAVYALIVVGALSLHGSVTHAQTCGGTMQPTITPTGVVFAVGQGVQVNLLFGPTAAAGGSQTITQLTVRLDCENALGCNVGNACTNGGDLLSYDGDQSITTTCDNVTITSNHPDGGLANEVVFTFTPALSLNVNMQCVLSFGATIVGPGPAGSPTIINGIGFFFGTCAGGLTGSACGTYNIPVVDPHIDIQTVPCPRIVCAPGGGEPVTFNYAVTTGVGTAPLVGPAVAAHPGSLPAQSQDGTWHRAIVVTDDTCGPGGPNTPLILAGDLNANGLRDPGENWAPDGDINNNAVLDPGETWSYQCTTVIGQTTTNTATAIGEYVNLLGSTPAGDTDQAIVNTVGITQTLGECVLTLCGGTDACAGETCSWTGPPGSGFTSNQCCITLDTTSVAGEYCVTVTCPGSQLQCPGNPPVSATCCIDVTPCTEGGPDDSVPPMITEPVPPIATCLGLPAFIEFPTATDNCDPNPIVTCTRSDGLPCTDPYFPPGLTNVTFTAFDACNNASVPVTIPVIPDCCDVEFETFYQSYWGSEAALDHIETLLSAPFGHLVIGKSGNLNPCSAKCKKPAAQAIVARLPAGGSARKFPSELGNAVISAWTLNTNPPLPLRDDGTFKNVLLGQTIALALNLRNDWQFEDGTLGSVSLAPSMITQKPDGAQTTWIIPQPVLDAMLENNLSVTINDLLELANRALAGRNVAPATLPQINTAVSRVNSMFVGGQLLLDCNCAQVPAFASAPQHDGTLGDLTGDGLVNSDDLATLLADWGRAGDETTADINGDGVVNPADVIELLNNWSAEDP